jgi:RHS repeat-associated protein
LRSTSILTDRNGNRIQHHEYSAFGRDRFTESLTTFPLSHRFTGQVLDEDTGLYYYNARYYDPELGRFIQPDTLIPHLDEPQSYNRYSYVLNNPLKYRDPTGNIEELDGVIVHKSGYVGSGVRTVRGPLGSISVAGLNPAELAAVNFQIAVGKGDALMQKVYAEQLRPYLAHASYEMILAGAYNPQATGNALMAMLPVAPAASPVLPRAAGQTATGHYGTPARASLPGSGQIDALAGRLAEIHGALDPIAARHRTTALLSTSGGNIIGGGGRDLTPAQRALVKPAELLAKQPGAHAEITVLGEATRRGLRPRAIVTSREICPSCQQELIDPRTSG